jgi:hypothetical protein
VIQRAAELCPAGSDPNTITAQPPTASRLGKISEWRAGWAAYGRGTVLVGEVVGWTAVQQVLGRIAVR